MSNRRPRTPRFRRPHRKGLLARSWMVLRAPVLLAIVFAAWWFFYKPYSEGQGWTRVELDFALCGDSWNGADGCVVDGDTLIIGNRAGRRRIRITGYDAPERDGACPAESERADEARVALHSWLGAGPFEWSGENAPPRDQYGRELREIRRSAPDESRDYLTEHMIESGLAAESGWGAAEVDWCAP